MLNTRLEQETIACILDHAGTKLVIVDQELVPLLPRAFDLLGRVLPAVEIADPTAGGESLGAPSYETLAQANPLLVALPQDEWDAIVLNYTSGTSGHPRVSCIITVVPI